jgi:hypothetical protein
MCQDPIAARNLSEKAGLGKHKRVFLAQKSPMRAIGCSTELTPQQDFLCQKRLNRLPHPGKKILALKIRC